MLSKSLSLTERIKTFSRLSSPLSANKFPLKKRTRVERTDHLCVRVEWRERINKRKYGKRFKMKFSSAVCRRESEENSVVGLDGGCQVISPSCIDHKESHITNMSYFVWILRLIWDFVSSNCIKENCNFRVICNLPMKSLLRSTVQQLI